MLVRVILDYYILCSSASCMHIYYEALFSLSVNLYVALFAVSINVYIALFSVQQEKC